MPAIAGAVLIGGHSRRMGRHKAAIDLGDGPLAAVLAERLSAAGCRPVWLVGADRGVDASVTRIDDRWSGAGPLGGVATAVAAAGEIGADAVVVVACDLPDLDVESLSTLVETFAEDSARPVVGRSPRGVEPLISIWPVALATSVYDAIAGAGPVKALLGQLGAREVSIAGGAARNVNRPEDL